MPRRSRPPASDAGPNVAIARPDPRPGSGAAVDESKKYDTVVSSGQSALRALLTMNGGAIIVFLTLLGHVWDKDRIVPDLSMGLFISSLVWWLGGVFATLLSYGAIFVTNCFSSVKWHKSSNVAFGVTLACGIGSLLSFVVGCVRAVDAFKALVGLLKR